MVADGEETLSDGRLEMASTIGFSCKFGLFFLFGKNNPASAMIMGSFIEYALGLAVAVIIFLTALGLLKKAMNVLLARAISTEKVAEIKRLVNRIEGVTKITDLVTFSDGTTVVCLLGIETRAETRAHDPVIRAIEKRIKKYIVESGECLGSVTHITLKSPEFRLHRQVQAMIVRGENSEMVSPDLIRATHIRIYDTDGFGRRERAVDIPLAGMTLPERVGKLIYKGVKEVLVFCGSEEERLAVEAAGIVYNLNFTLSPYVPPSQLEL